MMGVRTCLCTPPHLSAPEFVDSSRGKRCRSILRKTGAAARSPWPISRRHNAVAKRIEVAFFERLMRPDAGYSPYDEFHSRFSGPARVEKWYCEYMPWSHCRSLL